MRSQIITARAPSGFVSDSGAGAARTAVAEATSATREKRMMEEYVTARLTIDVVARRRPCLTKCMPSSILIVVRFVTPRGNADP